MPRFSLQRATPNKLFTADKAKCRGNNKNAEPQNSAQYAHPKVTRPLVETPKSTTKPDAHLIGSDYPTTCE